MSEKPNEPPKTLDYASSAVDGNGRRIRHSPGWIATEAAVWLIGAIACSLYFQSFLILLVGLVLAGFVAVTQLVVNRWGDWRIF